MQEGKMTYSNGEASMTMTDVLEGGKAGAMVRAGLNIAGSMPGGGPTAGIFAKAPGVKAAIAEIAGDAAKAVHGNSKLSKVETTQSIRDDGRKIFENRSDLQACNRKNVILVNICKTSA